LTKKGRKEQTIHYLVVSIRLKLWLRFASSLL